jgi:hypothetical protein
VTNPAAPQLLDLSLVQLAAEARYPDGVRTGLINPLWLEAGNGRSSRFTAEQAAQFAQDWEIVDHQPNTGTGFSGTLFQARRSDPARRLVEGQLVMSFRSTEFADDAVRDNDVPPSTATGFGLCGHLAKALI